MLDFRELHRRLARLLVEHVRNGQLTERGLSRMTGVSQPHMHNVLKGRREFSTEAADAVLREMHLDILDLLDARELLAWQQRRNRL